MDPVIESRFWSRVRKGSACWEWVGARHTGGYGAISVNGHQERAHRVSWMIHHGEIPDGLWVLHRCDNPPCVNPAHLFVGSDADNLSDAIAKGRRLPPSLYRKSTGAPR